jgi:peptidoglycan/LPS O-acetylase OafA/YrhL
MNQSQGRGRLRLYFALAVILPLVSFASPLILAAIGAARGGSGGGDLEGTLYAIFRVALFGCVIWSVFRLRHNELPQPRQNRKTGQTSVAWFDPLMGLRALAAAMVLLGHYFFIVYAAGPIAPRLPRIFNSLATSSPWAGVWIFFTLSGYLMGKGFHSGRYAVSEAGVRAFLRNRALRIAPVYYVAVLITAIFSTPAVLIPRHWWQLVLVGVFDFIRLPLAPIGILWSLTTEVQFYLLSPLFFLLLASANRRLGRAFLVVPISIGLAECAFRLHFFHPYGYSAPAGADGWEWLVYKPLMVNLDLFLAGMSLNFIEIPRNVRGSWAGWVLATLAGILYAVNTRVGYHIMLSPWAYNLSLWFTILCVAAFILLATSLNKVALDTSFRSLLLRGINRIGVLTYAIYVFHMNIMQAMRQILPPGLAPYKLTFAIFPGIVLLIWLVAEFVYRMVEEPFERRKHIPGTPLTDAP